MTDPVVSVDPKPEDAVRNAFINAAMTRASKDVGISGEVAKAIFNGVYDGLAMTGAARVVTAKVAEVKADVATVKTFFAAHREALIFVAITIAVAIITAFVAG